MHAIKIRYRRQNTAKQLCRGRVLRNFEVFSVVSQPVEAPIAKSAQILSFSRSRAEEFAQAGRKTGFPFSIHDREIRDEFPTVMQPTALGPSLLMIQMKDKRRLRTQQFDIRNRKFHRKPIVPPRLANRQIRINRYPGRIHLVEEEGVKTETCLTGWQQAVRIDVDSLDHNKSISGSRHDTLDKGGIDRHQTVRIDDPYQLRRASARLCQEFDYLRSRIRRSKIANRKII